MILSPVRRVICLLASLATLAPFVLRAYLVGPPEGLGEMTTNADLICKARVISSVVITNASFRLLSGFKACETKLEIISVLKGKPPAKFILFQHYAPDSRGMSMYSPQHYELEAGQSYLIFAVKAEHGEFQQIRMSHTGKEDEGVMRTLDDRPVSGLSVKDAHWLELNRLLADVNVTNVLYAVRQLDAMSMRCGQEWNHTGDFRREDVLKVVLPLAAQAGDEAAIAALNCFRLGHDCRELLVAHAEKLVEIADSPSSNARRVAAMAALSGVGFSVVSNALTRWVADPSDEVRAQAVLLGPDFPGAKSEAMLRERAIDISPKVRARVADAIGNGKIQSLLPTLSKLLSDPVGGTGDGNNGEVHTAAGYALVKFEANQVDDILKANLHDEAFRPIFLCKLAEYNTGPWLTNLVEVLEQRRIRVEQEVATSGIAPKERENYLHARMTLSDTYFNCWNILERFVSARPREAFADGRLDRCLDALEMAGTTGSREPAKLYELYRTMGLDRRAAELRKRSSKEKVGYDLGFYLDQIDARLHLPPPNSDK